MQASENNDFIRGVERCRAEASRREKTWRRLVADAFRSDFRPWCRFLMQRLKGHGGFSFDDDPDPVADLLAALEGIAPRYLGWYPSAGPDVRPLPMSCCSTLERLGAALPDSYREPDLWIFTDAGWDNLPWPVPGDVFDSPDFARWGLKVIWRCLVAVGDYAQLVRVEFASPVEPASSARVLLLKEDDHVVFQLLRSSGIGVSHLAVAGIGTSSQLANDIRDTQAIDNLGLGTRWALWQGHKIRLNWKDLGGRLQLNSLGQDATLLHRP